MKLEVRWLDGYLEIFENVVDWRAGYATLWVKYESRVPNTLELDTNPKMIILQDWIPMVNVRRIRFDGETRHD